MRAHVAFQFELTYADPARSLNQVLRLTPRSHDSQHVIDWFVGVEPDSRLRRSEDSFGNIVHACSHDGPLERILVTAEGVVEMVDSAGVLRGQAEKLPLDVFLRSSDATHAGKDLAAFARESVAGETEALGRLHKLMDVLHEECAFEPGDAPPRDANAAFATQKGSARELAQVFIAAARAENIPARFVSGLFLGDASFGAHHGWAEAYVAGIGWIGFDCALGYCPRDEHLRIAAGLDYFGAAPRRGAAFGFNQEMTTTTLSVDASKQASWQVQQ